MTAMVHCTSLAATTRKSYSTACPPAVETVLRQDQIANSGFIDEADPLCTVFLSMRRIGGRLQARRNKLKPGDKMFPCARR